MHTISTTQRRREILLVFAAVAVLVACGGTEETLDTAVAAGQLPAPATTTMDLSGLSDANILSVLALINGSEILAAQAAQQHATDSQVREFASDMIREHQSLQGSVDSVALSLNITPQSPPVADSMQAHMRAMRDSVDAIGKAEFDRAYMQSQLRAHEQALETLRQLATTADAAPLRATIDRAVQTVEAHLARARSMTAAAVR